MGEDTRAVSSFALASLGWWILAAFLCTYFRHAGQSLFLSLRWMTTIWALSVFDLYALSRAVGGALSLMSAEGEKRSALIIQASYWGVIKLACLGIIGALLLQGNSIPATGLVMGSSTLVVVPLLGGYWWSKRVLRHA